MTIALAGLAFLCFLGWLAAATLWDRERLRRRLAELRAERETEFMAERWRDERRYVEALHAQHAAELERLNNVWTTQALEQRKAKVIPAPPDAESRMLELVAKDQAEATAKAIQRGTDAVLAEARAAGIHCTREEAELTAKSMYASAMGGAGMPG